jgi:hypothetical protein
VTQLKWRLLEGGGQAYYEIGVADSGALVGLPRAELEQSIETLEMMAGEIGASVIIVKEVEVPAIMVGVTSAMTNVDSSIPCNVRNGASSRRFKMASSSGSLPSSVQSRDSDYLLGSMTEAETTDSRDTSATNLTDFEEEQLLPLSNVKTVMVSTADESAGAGVFSMDLELDEAKESIPLEINEVYKPRPYRVRAIPKQTSSHHTERRGGGPKPPRHNLNAASGDKKTKNNNKRFTRDKKRDAKRQALLTQVQISLDHNNNNNSNNKKDKGTLGTKAAHDDNGAITDELAQQLEELSVNVERTDPCEVASAPLVDADQVPHKDSNMVTSTTTYVTTLMDSDNNNSCGPRLIVEALVVRKLSIQEAFLDFGGFSLM